MSFAFFSHADAPERLSWRLVLGLVALAGIVYLAWRPPKRQVSETQSVRTVVRAVAASATAAIDVLFITCTEDFILLTPSRLADGEAVEVAAVAEWRRLVQLHGSDAGKPKRNRLRDVAELRMQAALATAKSWLLTTAETQPVICVLGNDTASQLTAWLRAACRDIPALHDTGSRIVCVAV